MPLFSSLKSRKDWEGANSGHQGSYAETITYSSNVSRPAIVFGIEVRKQKLITDSAYPLVVSI